MPKNTPEKAEQVKSGNITRTDNKNDFAMGQTRFAMGSNSVVMLRHGGVPLYDDEFTPPQDGFYQILPVGEFSTRPANHDEEIVQVYNRENLQHIVNNFSGEAMVDYEHFSHDTSKSTEAAGWFKELQLRDDGLYAKIRFSAKGKSDLQGGMYRFISPEVEGRPIDGKFHPHNVTGAGLTNRPSLKALKPLTNREGGATNNQEETMDYKILLCKLLNLAEDASDTSITEAHNRLSGDLPALRSKAEQLTEKETEITTLNKRIQSLETELIESDLEEYKDVIEDTEAVKSQLMLNREGTLKLLKGLKKPEQTPGYTPIHNRQTAGKPKDPTATFQKEDEEKAQAINAKAMEIMNRESCSWPDAFSRAQASQK